MVVFHSRHCRLKPNGQVLTLGGRVHKVSLTTLFLGKTMRRILAELFFPLLLGPSFVKQTFFKRGLLWAPYVEWSVRLGWMLTVVKANNWMLTVVKAKWRKQKIQSTFIHKISPFSIQIMELWYNFPKIIWRLSASDLATSSTKASFFRTNRLRMTNSSRSESIAR